MKSAREKICHKYGTSLVVLLGWLARRGPWSMAARWTSAVTEPHPPCKQPLPLSTWRQSRGVQTRMGRPPAPPPQPPPVTTRQLCRVFIQQHMHVQTLEEVVRLQAESCGLQGVNGSDLAACTTLIHAELGDNMLPLEAFAWVPRLQRLELPLNGLKNIELEAGGFSQLSVLDLSFNTVSENAIRHLARLPQLRSLDLSHNELTVLPSNLGGFAELSHLVLDHNSLRSPNAIQALAGFPQLSSLSMEHNQLTFVPRLVAEVDHPAVPFPQLQIVSFVANRIATAADILPLTDWPALLQVNLWENPLVTQHCALPADVQSYLQTCGLHVARRPAPECRPSLGLSTHYLVTVDTSMPNFRHLGGPGPGEMGFLEFTTERTLPSLTPVSECARADVHDNVRPTVRPVAVFLTEAIDELEAEEHPVKPEPAVHPPAEPFSCIEDLRVSLPDHAPRPNTVTEAVNSLKFALQHSLWVEEPPSQRAGRRRPHHRLSVTAAPDPAVLSLRLLLDQQRRETRQTTA